MHGGSLFLTPFERFDFASMGWMVNEAIYMLIAMQGNFLIMYVNEHIGWIYVGQIQTVNNMLTSC